jgi:signal transduction histidine kinase/DNA-binding response OmpR family regulator/HPt (histidine-containing phosphotransfer) domain-containing protein
MTVFQKNVLTIVLVAVFIITVSIGAGTLFMVKYLYSTIGDDLTAVAEIGDKYVSEEINRLKRDLEMLSLRYQTAGKPDLTVLWNDFDQDFPGFWGLSLFDQEKGLVASAGDDPPPAEILTDDNMRNAFRGETILSATRIDQNDHTRMYVAASCGDLVMAATISGLHFYKLFEDFTLWKTGHFFLNDAEGYVLASVDPAWINSRRNFMQEAETNSRYAELAYLDSKMIQGGRGIEQFSIGGVRQIAAYRPVSGSRSGWSLAVAAPVRESPLRYIASGMPLIGVICIALSIIAAFIAARFLQRPYEEIAALKETAEAASSAKTSFLANMSHEMRTPLNAVIGLSELTLNEEISNNVRGNIEKIHNSGTALLGIVNDILDLSKIETGKFYLVPVEYDLPNLINDAININITRIGNKPIRFNLYLDGSLPARLSGDDLRVKQILNNILSNAFKYTNKGSIDWTITARREDKYVWLTFEVKDTGIGIKAENLSSLFTDYKQLDMKANRKIEGTGLGLSIAKQMAEMMRGGISVESEYGKGSAFRVWLRQDCADYQPIGNEVAENLKKFRFSDTKRRNRERLVRIQIPYARVLVVDDVSTNLAVARGILKPYGMKVDCVNSGIKAIALIRQAEVAYNAVFMDHMMPEMDGIEAVKYIRNEIGTEYARNIPIIALTANAISGTQEMFLQNGFNDFISKPIDVFAMDAVVRRWVRDEDKEKELGLPSPEQLAVETALQTESEDAGQAVLQDPQIPGLDFSAGLGRFGNSAETYLEVLGAYTGSTPELLAKLKNPLPEKLAEYAVTVHGVKGGSRNIGALALGDRAEVLEKAAKTGDFAYVNEQTPAFINEAEALLAPLSAFIAKIEAARRKPRREEPDPETLVMLLAACRSFDIDAVDRAMEQINEYEYGNNELMDWLKEKLSLMDFKNIIERLQNTLGGA